MLGVKFSHSLNPLDEGSVSSPYEFQGRYLPHLFLVSQLSLKTGRRQSIIPTLGKGPEVTAVTSLPRNANPDLWTWSFRTLSTKWLNLEFEPQNCLDTGEVSWNRLRAKATQQPLLY